MKLEVGMYVRTKKGKILKCFKSESMNLPIYYVIGSKTNSYIEYQDVKKVSGNIIDILEAGDYVNGELVLGKVLYGNNAGVKVFGNIYYSEDIKSIVTKEQFSTMTYRVGD